MSGLIGRAVRAVKNDISAAKTIPMTGPMLLLIVAVAFPTFWFTAGTPAFNVARPAFFAALIILFTIAVKWPLRRHAWFRATMASLAILHLPLIMFVPWGSDWVPGVAIYGLCAVDFFVMLFVVELLAQLPAINRTQRNSDGDP